MAGESSLGFYREIKKNTFFYGNYQSASKSKHDLLSLKDHSGQHLHCNEWEKTNAKMQIKTNVIWVNECKPKSWKNYFSLA